MIINNLCEEIFLTPLVYSFIRKIDDVNVSWYTIKIYHTHALDWIVEELPVGSWRYEHGMADGNHIDLREDVYSWFLLKWG